MGVVGPDNVHQLKSVWPLVEIFVPYGEEKEGRVVKTTKTVGEQELRHEVFLQYAQHG